jgi:hypothetical protein
MKKLLFLISILLFSPFFLFAQENIQRAVEVDYPRIQDIKPASISAEGLPEYVIYLFYFLIALALVITTLSLIRGGLSWLTARGDPAKIREGRERITGSIFGIIIILSSSLFLSSINPEIVQIDKLEVTEIEEPFPPGIYLSPREYIPQDIENIEGDVYRISRPIRNLEDTPVRSIRIANQLDGKGNLLGYYYAVVLHELTAFRGRCALFINESNEFKDFLVPEGASSISIIQVNMEPPKIGKVMAYMRPDFNENYPYQALSVTQSFLPLSIGEVWSIDIEGKYAVILASGNSWETTGEGCGVFLDSKPIPDLKEHHMNKCNPRTMMPFFAAYESCATHYSVLPLFR